MLDVRLPGLSGLDLQRELAAADISLPIIFLTGYGDIPMSVGAMKAGAVEFLTKPFREQELLDAIRHAIDRDRLARAERRNSRSSSTVSSPGRRLERAMQFFKPGVQRIVNLMAAGAAVCAFVLPVTWAYRQAQEARQWRETACAYRLREAARQTDTALAVRYGDDACGALGRQGLGFVP